MNLSPSVSSNILRFTTDPSLAAEIVDILGVDAVDVHTDAIFDPAWVQKAQRRPVKIAAYVAAHCDDPSTQEKIWNSSKRLKVLRALASSLLLDDDLRQKFLASRPAESYGIDAEITDALRVLPRRGNIPALLALFEAEDAPFESLSDFSYTSPLPAILAHPEITSDVVDRVLAFALAANAAHAATVSDDDPGSAPADALLANAAVAVFSGSDNYPSLTLHTYSPAVLLAGVSRQRLVDNAVSSIAAALSDAGAATKRVVDAGLAGFLKNFAPRTNRYMYRVHGSHVIPATPRFTREAVDILINNPEWHVSLGLTKLDDDQAIALIKAMDQTTSTGQTIAGVQSNTPARLEAYLDHLDTIPDHITFEGYLRDWLTPISDPLSPIIDRVILHGDNHDRGNYLSGVLGVAGSDAPEYILHPNQEQFIRVAKTLPPSTVADYTMFRNNSTIPEETVYAAIDQIPGIAHHILHRRDIESSNATKLLNYILERVIVVFGSHARLAFEMLDDQKSASLNDIIFLAPSLIPA